MTNIIWGIIFAILMIGWLKVRKNKPNAPRTGLFKNDRRVENWKDLIRMEKVEE